MRLFFSAGEPSGDLHTASLIRELRWRARAIKCLGFGGGHMKEAGCELIFPLAEFPIIGILPALRAVPKLLGLLRQADDLFQEDPPDAVVLVDNPGFNWWVARKAKARGIPVFYFLPPQIWAWASWRVAKMRKLVDHVLCSLPFEVDWYRSRNLDAVFTGHPYFDELREQQIDQQFLSDHTGTLEQPTIAILPGSRTSEVHRILPAYLEVARRIAERRPATRFLVACYREDHLQYAKKTIAGLPLEISAHFGKTPEIIQAAQVCLSKSGSVSLELLFHAKPSTVLYQVSRANHLIYRFGRCSGWISTEYITLVNIMAGEQLFPEYVRCSDLDLLSDQVLRWLDTPETYHRIVAQLNQLRDQVAAPGATARTAQYILEHLRAEKHPQAA